MGDKAQCQPVIDSTGRNDDKRRQTIATRTVIKHDIGRYNGRHSKEQWNASSTISLSPAPAMSQHFDSHGLPPRPPRSGISGVSRPRERQNGLTQYITKRLA